MLRVESTNKSSGGIREGCSRPSAGQVTPALNPRQHHHPQYPVKYLQLHTSYISTATHLFSPTMHHISLHGSCRTFLPLDPPTRANVR